MARPQAPAGAVPTPSPSADTRERLIAVRDRLEAVMAGCGDRELAPLVAQYTRVLAQLDALAGPTEGSIVDELSNARAARRAKAAGL